MRSASQYPVDEDIYIDYADVVMTKACVHGAEAAILIARGYDLTLDNQKLNDEATTIESALAAHPQCASTIRDQASLDDAKLETRLALNLYEKFDIAIMSRTSGKMHFFEYDPKYDEQWQAAVKSLRLAKTALDDVVTVKGEDYMCFKHFKQTNLNERVTLAPFFNGKILRNLLPPFVGDRPVLSSIPDITFEGMFPDWTMENRMKWLKKINGIWYDGAFPPVISAPASFDGPFAEVVITDRSPEARIFYTTDCSDPAENGKEYTDPFKVFASCTIRAVAVTEQFGVSEETTATIVKVFGIGDAVGSYDATIACTSDVPWTVDMSVAHDGGEASMRSGTITSSEESPDRNYSTMSATYAGKGTLVFWWKVSCEDDGSEVGAEYDFLGAYVNGIRKYAIDGETDWERVELAFTDEGEHHIEWKYSKDDIDEDDIRDDCGWVDDVVWIPEGRAGAIPGATLSTYPAVPFDWIDKHGIGPRYQNGGATFEQAAKMPSPTGKKDANGNVLSVLDEYVAGTDPQDESDTFHAEIEIVDGKAVVKWHPELLPEETAKRVYRTFGRELLGFGEWVELIDGNTDGFNFFKTSVEWK